MFQSNTFTDMSSLLEALFGSFCTLKILNIHENFFSSPNSVGLAKHLFFNLTCQKVCLWFVVNCIKFNMYIILVQDNFNFLGEIKKTTYTISLRLNLRRLQKGLLFPINSLLYYEFIYDD